MQSLPGRHGHHVPLAQLAAVALASATLLAACGGKGSPAAVGSTTTRRSSTTTSTTLSRGATTSTASSSSTTRSMRALPPPCSLMTAAQASAALGATVTEVETTVVGSRKGCKWVVKASSLVTGLGSNIVLDLSPPPSSSRSRYYKRIEATRELNFKPVKIAGIPAVAGFGPDNEVQVDVGPALVGVAALSSVSAEKNSTAAEQAATYIVEALCRKIACRR